LPGRAAAAEPEQVGRLDWHNEVSRLLLEISEELRACPDEKSRRVLIRRLQRALHEKDDRHSKAEERA
jgi:metallo-beta-lactamase family protein